MEDLVRELLGEEDLQRMTSEKTSEILPNSENDLDQELAKIHIRLYEKSQQTRFKH